MDKGNSEKYQKSILFLDLDLMQSKNKINIH